MYYQNGTYYTEEHSVSFGDLITRTSEGKSYVDFNTVANTWTTWHLIPSSRPSIEHPTVATKFVEIPGANGMLDLTTYLTGGIIYGQRQGSLDFQVDNGHEHWEAIRREITRVLHGKRMKMRLMDDPNYYYEGRFTVGRYTPGPTSSNISISYQLEPFKLRINPMGTTNTLWDPFNFDEDYDWSAVMSTAISVSGNSKTYQIYAGDYAFTPTLIGVSGSVTATFGGVSRTVGSGGVQTLGPASNGMNTLTVNGNGSCRIEWREGGL